MNLFYYFVQTVFSIAGSLWFRLDVVGMENLPREGGLLVVCNHASNLDPPVVGCKLPREGHFLAKEELFHGLFGKICSALNAHPINRAGMDRKALRTCTDVLKSGGMLVIFPEGTRTRDGELQPAKSGAAMIAAQAGVPICPLYIDGTFNALPRGVSFPRRVKVRLHIGKPFSPQDALGDSENKRGKYEALSDAMMAHIAELKNAIVKSS